MYKKNFLKMSILFATLGILAFSFIPAASAGVPGRFKGEPGGNNLLWAWFNPSFPFSASENLYFRVGWATTEQELEDDWAPKQPWQVKLFINNEEISLQRYGYVIEKEKDMAWYHFFGAGYFIPGGEYLLRWEFWVKRPYQGDGKNYWRIFEDYWGVYGDPGTVWSFEYPLNIIA